MQACIAENINRFYYAQLAGYAGRLAAHYKKNAIHDFRVDIKKLKAFYRLLSLENTPEKALTLPRKLKKMYSALGAIRDLQQQKAHIDSFARHQGLAPAYLLTRLRHQLKKQRSRKTFLLPHKYFIRQAEKTGRRLPPYISPETLRGFLAQKRDNIRSIVEKGRFEDDALHTIRKNIKDMMYVSAIYTQHLQSALPLLFWPENEQKKMEALAGDLGDYNDAANRLLWLRQTTAGYKGRDRKEIVSCYQAQVQEKKALRNKIIPALQSLVRPEPVTSRQS